MRVLFAWELGHGLGHLVRIHGLASELVRLGHDAVLASRNVEAARQVLADAEIKIVAAPAFRPARADDPSPAESYAQLLNDVGFGDARGLAGACLDWRRLFDSVDPDLVVFDHSPTALLASRGCGFQRVIVGTGFECPPKVTPLPSLHVAEAPQPQRVAAIEAQTLANANAALVQLAAPPMQALCELYHGTDAQLLATLPELDHFGARPGGRYMGVWSKPARGAPRWPNGDGPRVFVYLLPLPYMEPVLAMLRQRQWPTLALCPGWDDAACTAWSRDTLLCDNRLLDMGRLCRECDLAVLNGNHATTADMVLAGTPTLHLPVTVEHALMADRVEAQGYGLAAPRELPDVISDKLDMLAHGLDGFHQAMAPLVSGPIARDQAAIQAVVRAIVGGRSDD